MRRSLLNKVLLWCCLVEQDAEEYVRYLCYASDATGNIPGNISGYQIHDESLIVEVSLAPLAVDERTTIPAETAGNATPGDGEELQEAPELWMLPRNALVLVQEG